ncbi:hypothetical protein AB0B28_06410 [Glycomyces sp. NPDC046736]|uniref:hypothetical protein n=1 Tax=Glycomyces sp. NPDC046736 TaxID=3155615 RepID=UPI0033E391C2
MEVSALGGVVMGKWVGVLLGEGCKRYVAGSILRAVDALAEARIYNDRSSAYADARALQVVAAVERVGGEWRPLYPWITDIDAERIESGDSRPR